MNTNNNKTFAQQNKENKINTLIDLKYIVFSSPSITTYLNKNNKEKKEFNYLPTGWQHLEKSNYNINHEAFYILTGKKSDLTVLDFDDEESYEKLVTKFPKLKSCCTIKTKNGYHMYFNYTNTYKSGTDFIHPFHSNNNLLRLSRLCHKDCFTIQWGSEYRTSRVFKWLK